MAIEARRTISCLISSRVIISLGVKPVRGGRPARESRTNIVKVVRAGVFGHVEEISDILVA